MKLTSVLHRLFASPNFVIILLSLAYTTVTIMITFLIHESYHTYAFDLGIFTQSLKYTLQGQMLYHTIAGGSELANHFSPVLFFMVPVYWIFPYVQTLLVLQSVALGFSGYLTYMLAKEYGYSRKTCLIITVMFFVNPLVWGVALFDFHPVVFAIPALLVMFIGLKRKSWLYFCSGLFFALISKEDVIIAVGVFGLTMLLYTFWKTRKLDPFSVIMLVSALLFYGLGVIVSASISPDGVPAILSYFTNRYTYTGHSLFTTIKVALWILFSSGSWLLICAYLVPLGFLPLLSLQLSVPGLMIMLSGMLSTNPGQHDNLLQYSAAAIPFLFYAFIDAFARFINDPQINGLMKRTHGRIGTYALALLLIAAIGIVSVGRINFAEFPDEHDRALNKIIAAVPEGASITASNEIFPHLCSWTDTYLPQYLGTETGIKGGDWGFPERATEYIIIDYMYKSEYFGGYWEYVIKKQLEEKYYLMLEIDGARLYKLDNR